MALEVCPDPDEQSCRVYCCTEARAPRRYRDPMTGTLIVFYDVEVTLTDGTSWQSKATEVQPAGDLLRVVAQHGPLATRELIETFPLHLVDHWTVTPQRWPSGEVVAA